MKSNSFDAMKLALLFCTYVAISCSGLYLMKAAPSWLSAKYGVGVVMYFSGAVLWMLILRLFPLSVAFPVAAGALVLGTILTGVLFLNESLTLSQSVGAALIVCGIGLIAIKDQIQ
jgi:multidrug transporter EmrE-like cation transporter